MVVDDDAGTRFVLRMILEKEGHSVLDAPHGAAALALIGPSALPDVLMTDLMMPILNGEELILRIRSEPTTAAIPIVIVSGNDGAAKALHSSGLVEGVLHKPFEPAELIECVRAVAKSSPKAPLTSRNR
jgi:CheY-like chemotaxis protein